MRTSSLSLRTSLNNTACVLRIHRCPCVLALGHVTWHHCQCCHAVCQHAVLPPHHLWRQTPASWDGHRTPVSKVFMLSFTALSLYVIYTIYTAPLQHSLLRAHRTLPRQVCSHKHHFIFYWCIQPHCNYCMNAAHSCNCITDILSLSIARYPVIQLSELMQSRVKKISQVLKQQHVDSSLVFLTDSVAPEPQNYHAPQTRVWRHHTEVVLA